MPNAGLILTLSAGLTGALTLGYITHRLGWSPIVGYLLAGMLLGHGIMPDVMINPLVTTAIASIILNPVLLRSLHSVEEFLGKHRRHWNLLNRRSERRVLEADSKKTTKAHRREITVAAEGRSE